MICSNDIITALTYYQLIYEEFEKEFNFPKLFSHSGAGHHPPSWFIYKKHGYHKKVDWDNVRDIAIIITEDILKWFTRFNDKEDIPYLKKSIEKEVNNTFIEYSQFFQIGGGNSEKSIPFPICVCPLHLKTTKTPYKTNGKI